MVTYLRKIANRLFIASETPEEILKVMDMFKELLSNDGNFIDPSQWGTEVDGKKAVPFSFSKEGLAKVESFRSFKPFQHAYSGGTHGIHGEHYNLTYFLTQYLVALIFEKEKYEIASPKNDSERALLNSISEKTKKVEFRIDPRRLYSALPIKPYDKTEYTRARSILSGIIHEVEKDYTELNKSLTPEEKTFISNF